MRVHILEHQNDFILTELFLSVQKGEKIKIKKGEEEEQIKEEQHRILNCHFA